MPENGPSNTRRRAWEVFACRNDIFYDDEKASSIFQVQMTTCLTYTGVISGKCQFVQFPCHIGRIDHGQIPAGGRDNVSFQNG